MTPYLESSLQRLRGGHVSLQIGLLLRQRLRGLALYARFLAAHRLDRGRVRLSLRAMGDPVIGDEEKSQ